MTSKAGSGEKYAVIGCEDAPKWGGPYGSKRLCDMFRNHPDEEWEYFAATQGNLPDIKKLHEYSGFILTGSHYSANDPHPWIVELEKFIKNVLSYQQKKQNNDCPKLVGICFGHQLMAKAAGAKVVKNDGGKFIFELCKINVDKYLKEKSFYENVFGEQKGNSFVLFQSHSEEVKDIPFSSGNLQSVGNSDSCEHEILLFNQGAGISFQGHMEITTEECVEKILPAIKNVGLYTDEQEIELKRNLKVIQNEREEVVVLIKRFLADE